MIRSVNDIVERKNQLDISKLKPEDTAKHAAALAVSHLPGIAFDGYSWRDVASVLTSEPGLLQKANNYRQSLVQAAAYLVAEIDRIDSK